MTTEAKESKIPLQCLICPSIPKFSDTSHLLTHVGSKGHLSHQHKLEIRGESDPVAQSLLESYKEWYSQNGIQILLAERLTIRDVKKAQIEQQSKSTNAISPPNAAVSKKRVIKYEGGLTSDLCQIVNTAELESFEQPIPPTPINQPAKSDFARTPKVHLWSTVKRDPVNPSLSRFGLHSRPISSDSIGSDKDQGKENGFEIDYFREQPPKSQNTTSQSVNSCTQSPDRTRGSAVGTHSSERIPGLQLKGIYWPGMDLFDAATVEMKRKRNQKKDPSVLEHMRENSKAVEAKEFIYQANGDFLRAKQFSEEDADESAISSSVSTKKKPKRATLGDKSTNAKTKMVKRATGSKPAKALNTVLPGRASQRTRATAKSSFTSRSQKRNESNSLNDENSDLNLTLGRQVAPKKHALSVFEDDVPISASFVAEEAEYQRATAEVLAEGLSNDEEISNSPHVLSLLNSGPPSMTFGQIESSSGEEGRLQRSTSRVHPKDISCSGKENIEPIYTRDGRIEDNRYDDQTTTPSLPIGQGFLTASQQTLYFTSHTMSSDFFYKSVGPFGNPLTSFQWPSSFLNQQFHGHGLIEDALERDYPVFNDAVNSQVSGRGNIFV